MNTPSSTRITKNGLLPVLLIFLLTSTGACRKTDAPRTSIQKITIAQWGQERYLIYLPLYVAMDRDFFAKRGIAINLIFTGNDDQTFASVISGHAQFGVGDPVFTAIAQERGFPAKVVATIVGGVAIWGLTKNPSTPIITSPSDLKGLRVGTFPSPSTNYTLMKQVIADHPDALSTTKIVQAPIGSQLALLEAGTADIAMELEPATSIAESKGYRVVYSSPTFHGPYAFTGLTTTSKLIKEQPDLVLHIVEGLEEAVVACHKDPTIAIAVGTKLFPTLERAVIEHAVNRMLSERTFPPHVVVTPESWQAALRTRLTVGDLHKPQATEIAVDNSFASRAMNGH